MRITKSLIVTGIAIASSFSYHSTANESVSIEKEITLEKIMSDPKWISNSPTNASWLPNSKDIVYNQKKDSGELNNTFVLDTQSKETKEIPLSELHKTSMKALTYNVNGDLAAYIFEGDLFLLNIPNNELTQLTYTSNKESSPKFLNTGELSFWQGDTVFTVNLETNLIKELIRFSMSDQPKAPKEPEDIIAKEQHELINFVAKKHKASIEKHEYINELKAKNNHVVNTVVHLGASQRKVNASLSPNGDKVFIVTAKSKPRRGEEDLMPNYIGQDGRIQFEDVRRRVSDAEPNQQNFWLVDIKSHQADKISINDLPDFNKDVLKAVRKENAKAQGTKYKSKKVARTINLIQDWTWSQTPIQWHSNGKHLAVMLEAWDNKDRWIATIDFNKSKFVTQHQLHDDAWINYTFNDFGWFHNSNTLYFLSEQSGYSHIYTKSLSSKKTKQLTNGQFEVSEIYLTKNDEAFYFRANVTHPGDYQIYKVSSKAKKVSRPTAITSLKGNNHFSISPDESKLLITHSNLLTPEELYLQPIDSTSAQRLTMTVTEEFMSMPWVKPEVVEVASSFADQPIYAKVYYPKDYKQGEKRRAVIFNHGAGYLQNSDFGFSGYFREFMFHNMLAQQGYVVMDMDYRASKGYGRDWRTAIYRQMGTPEIQDLRDGVNWLVDNANVDRQRIGTYGGSYGGFMTFMALFNQPDLFQAGAALRPVSDWAHYNDGYTSNILNRPEDDMIAYRRSSPIYFAEGLEKPLLINAPMIDNNVFFLDVVRLVQRMIELEKEDFETAIYPVERHGFVQPSSWLDEYRRIYKLFETNL